MKKRTHEEYVAELKDKNPDIEVIERYINSSTKIRHRCLKDGYEWDVAPSTVLSGHGCPMCNGGIKTTNEQYVNRLHIINPSIIPIEQYVNSNTKIKHRCLVDGYEWYVTPANTLNGKGCPLCGGTMHKTQEQYVEELKLKNPNIIAIGQYINHSTKIMHKCLKHNYEWMASPHTILSGCGCPMCKNDKLSNAFKISHDEYVNKLYAVNKNIVVLGEYVNARTPIKHKCLIDGWEWDATPENLLKGHGCPQCNKCSKSNGEKLVSKWLDANNITYKKQKTFDDCRDKQVLQFDFYLPDYNIVIEYNGKQHYEPVDYFGGKTGFEYTVKHDKMKTDYCKKNNIMLFIIPYFKNLYDELESLHNLIKDTGVAA